MITYSLFHLWVLGNSNPYYPAKSITHQPLEVTKGKRKEIVHQHHQHEGDNTLGPGSPGGPGGPYQKKETEENKSLKSTLQTRVEKKPPTTMSQL